MDIKVKVYFSRNPAGNGLIDLHAHLLPDWDDGPDSWEETQEMVEIAAADGVEAICLTPHIFRFSRYQDSQEVLEERFNQFYEQYRDEKRIKFFRGAEVFIHPDLERWGFRINTALETVRYLARRFPGFKPLSLTAENVAASFAPYIPYVDELAGPSAPLGDCGLVFVPVDERIPILRLPVTRRPASLFGADSGSAVPGAAPAADP